MSTHRSVSFCGGSLCRGSIGGSSHAIGPMAIQSAIIVETAMEIGVTMVELVMALATIIAPIPKTTIMATTLYGLIMWLLPVF